MPTGGRDGRDHEDDTFKVVLYLGKYGDRHAMYDVHDSTRTARCPSTYALTGRRSDEAAGSCNPRSRALCVCLESGPCRVWARKGKSRLIELESRAGLSEGAAAPGVARFEIEDLEHAVFVKGVEEIVRPKLSIDVCLSLSS